MPIDARTMPTGEPLYTFVDPATGENTNIAVARLRKFLMTVRPEVFDVPLDPALAESFINDNLASLDRAVSLTPAERREPIIFVMDGTYTDGRPDVLLVDGRHRYLRAVLEDDKMIPAYVLTYEQWQPWRVVNYRQVTAQDLINEPIKHRPYWRKP